MTDMRVRISISTSVVAKYEYDFAIHLVIDIQQNAKSGCTSEQKINTDTHPAIENGVTSFMMSANVS